MKPSWSVKKTLLQGEGDGNTLLLDNQDVQRIATLSQLKVSGNEQENEILIKRLNKILTFAKTIEEHHRDEIMDSKSKENEGDTAYTILNSNLHLPLREDAVQHVKNQEEVTENNESKNNNEKNTKLNILSNARETKWDYFVIEQAVNDKIGSK
eukprot:g6655.t1